MRYCGVDFEHDMKLAREDEETHRWWKIVRASSPAGRRRAHPSRADEGGELELIRVGLVRFGYPVRPDAEELRQRRDRISGRSWLVGKRGGGVQDGELVRTRSNRWGMSLARRPPQNRPPRHQYELRQSPTLAPEKIPSLVHPEYDEHHWITDVSHLQQLDL